MANKINRFTLGTVQFGLDYGINNDGGKTDIEEVKKILATASNLGIKTLDTATSYGESEKVLGEVLSSSPHGFNIISKFPTNSTAKNISGFLKQSFALLKTDQIHGYLAHDINTVRNHPGVWQYIESQKEKLRIKKTGLSFYFPEDLRWAIDRGLKFDIVQIPFNIFDRRFESLFEELNQRNIEIHIRSVFLQGLLLKDSDLLNSHFSSIQNNLMELKKFSINIGIPLNILYLRHALNNPFIDQIVLGVDSSKQLEENLMLDDYNFNEEHVDYLNSFSVEDETIILPYKWPS